LIFAAWVFATGTPLAMEPGIRLSAPWFRMIIPSRPVAGYFTLANDGAQPLSLVGAASPRCTALMLHRSVSQGGVEQMEFVKSVSIPGHGSVSFAPGGYPLMCMSPAGTVAPGALVPVTLKFADGGSLTANFVVRGAAGK
jgi:copper(I)-binding protein